MEKLSIKQVFISGVLLICIGACQKQNVISPSNCVVKGYTQFNLRTLQSDQFVGLSVAELDKLALALSACTGSSDPVMRDEIVYTSLSTLLRKKQISKETQTILFLQMLSFLDGEADDDGFLKPFAALNLSELARADRVEPYLTAQQREKMVQTTINYMMSITDYRGFDYEQGWRHGVAHTADVILQLTLNPNIDTAQILRLRTAITSQIVPESGHAYIHGETERLARPILYMVRRGDIDIEDWTTWIEKVHSSAPLTSWQHAFFSNVGLARLHNTKAFLIELYIHATESKNDNIKQILPSVRKTLFELP